MIRSHIDLIEQRIRESSELPAEHRDEILAQLAELRTEAEAISGSEERPLPADTPTSESEPITPILNDLSAAVDGLETAHPRLVQLTNQISLVLANMGI